MASALDRLAARLERAERNIRALSTPQLAHSSVEQGGAIDVNDVDGQTVMQMGGQFDGSYVALPLSGPTPPTPTTPTVTPDSGALKVRWDGLFVGDAVVPMDFSRVEVHVSTTAGFDATSAATLYGTIETPRGGELSILLPPVAHHVKLVTRSLAGKASSASQEATGTPEIVVTDADLSAVDQAVQQAQSDADAAAASAASAQTAATNAQTAADNAASAASTADSKAAAAQSAADAAQADVDGIPAQIATAKSEAISTSATDAQAKADAAEQAAKDAAALDAQAKADQAKADALAGAAVTAQEKADAAKAQAIADATAQAATDAQNKADLAEAAAINAAATDATTKADAAEQAAIDAAAITAQQKADAAKSAAIAAAATDAQAKADAAKQAAIDAAALTAQDKADLAEAAALADAKTYADTKKTEAISAAASDATTKAGNAQTAAISAAATDATSKANNAIAVSLPRVMATSTLKTFHQPFAWTGGAQSVPGSIVIDTPITFGNYMTAFKITGYNYSGTAANIDLLLTCYFYSGGGGTFYNSSQTSTGSASITAQWGKKTVTGNAALILDIAGGLWAYPKIVVERVDMGQTLPPDSFKDGWSGSLLTDLSAYSALMTPPRRDIADTHTLTQGWRSTGKTTIDGGKITADSITAGQIATDAITANELKAGAVVAGKLAADSVLAANIKAGEIAAGHLAANSVIAGKIATDAVTAGTIAAGAVTAGKIAANAVTADTIAAGALTIGAVTNLQSTLDGKETPAGAQAKADAAETAATSTAATDAQTKADAAKAAAISTAASDATTKAGNAQSAAQSYADTTYGETKSLVGGWRVTGLTTINGGQIATDTVTASQIKAGAIIAGKLATDAVLANNIKAGEVVAGKLAADAVVASNIAADAVLARNIKAGEITAAKMAAGTITAASGVIGSIDASKITVGKITAAQMAAGTITAASGVIGDIDAAKITVGKITAAQMAAGTITAASGIIGSIDASKITVGTITAAQLAADAIDGKTISGATIIGGEFVTEASATGSHWEFGTSSFQNTLLAYTGRVEELSPAGITSDNAYGGVLIQSSDFGSPNGASQIVAGTDGTGSFVSTYADTARLTVTDGGSFSEDAGVGDVSVGSYAAPSDLGPTGASMSAGTGNGIRISADTFLDISAPGGATINGVTVGQEPYSYMTITSDYASWSTGVWAKIGNWSDNGGTVGITQSAGRWTFTTPGRYAISAAVSWRNNTTGIRGLGIRLNGGASIRDILMNATSTAQGTVMNIMEARFSAGDYIEFWGYQNSGVNTVAPLGGTTLGGLSIRYVGS